MKPFTEERGIAAPLEGRNIDTDQIVPARFLKQDRSKGYGHILFHDLRFDDQGAERPGFVLNRDPFRHATILVADENFGCGSSREAAVYALADFGIRAVIAPSFGDIFHNNCLKNGILPVRLDKSVVHGLQASLAQLPDPSVHVDLLQQQVTLPDGSRHAFSTDAFWRECLVKGVDDLALTLSYGEQVEGFVQSYYRQYPWIRLARKATPSP